MTKAGNRVVFDADGSYVQNKATGFKTGIAEENGTYSMVVWTQARKGVKQFNRFEALASVEEDEQQFASDFQRPA